MSKHTYLSPDIDNILLIISLKSSIDAVFVPTYPGQQTFVPHIVILVRFGSLLPGRTSQITEVQQISFSQSFGMSSNLMTQNVFVPSTLFLIPLIPVPTPCYNLPISFENDLFHVSWNLGKSRHNQFQTCYNLIRLEIQTVNYMKCMLV